MRPKFVLLMIAIRYLGPENTIFMHKTALDIGADVTEFGK